MKINSESLDGELDSLKEEFKKQLSYHQHGRKWHYNNLVKAFLWCLQAEKDPEYLKQMYIDNGFSGKHTYNLLLKLLWGWQQKTQKAKISQNAAALSAIEKEYKANTYLYRGESKVANLVSWIDDNGGISGLTKNTYDAAESHGSEETQDTRSASGSKKGGNVNNKKQLENEFANEKKVLEHKKDLIHRAFYSKREEFVEHDLGPVPSTEADKLVVLLARKDDETGRLSIVGNSADEHLVNDAVLKIGHINTSILPDNLRAIAEVLRLAIIPKSLYDLNLHKQFYPDSKTEKMLGEKQYTFKQYPRLLVKSDGSLLVSKSCSDSSVVAKLIPDADFPVKKMDVFLRGSDRQWFEDSIINKDRLSLYTCKPKNGLGPKKQGTKSKASIELNNLVTNHKRNLYFYDADELNDSGIYQTTVAQDDISYDWEVTGSKQYFKHIFQSFFDVFFVKMKKRINIVRNKSAMLVIHKHGIEIQAKWDEEQNCYQNTGEHFTIKFNNQASVSSIQNNTFRFSPLDAYRVFESFDTYEQLDNIKMCGNESIVRITWNHEQVGAFEVYIPACDVKGVRDTTYFLGLE